MTRTLLFILILSTSCFVVEPKSKNVVFITVDDLRPQYNAYLGDDSPITVHPQMATPNLDKLASGSFLLKRAHTQCATCAPSRTSFLTGRRPDTTGIYKSKQYWRLVTGDFTTLPQYFKDHGYHTQGMGKVFHGGSRSSGSDDPISWSVKYYQPPSEHNTHFWYHFGKNHSWFSVNESMLAANDPLPDQQTADYAVETIKSLNSSGNPFFLAIGFHRPHLPFIVPREYYDKYPLDDIRLPTYPYAPTNLPEVAWCNFMSDELRRYVDLQVYNLTGEINDTMPDNLVKSLRRGYYASVSYVDDLVGKVLDQLEESNLVNDTIISLLGDHGFHLGENGEWHKHTNFERATHTPMMIRVPGVTDGGVQTNALTELVDVFPTLVELAGLPRVPMCPFHSSNIRLCTEGISMVPLITQPARTWKNAVFTQFYRSRVDVMGYSVRTDRYRYTEWPKFNKTHKYPDWTDLQGIELYDYQIDPHETVNRAGNDDYKDIEFELRDFLRVGWRMALPPLEPPVTNPDTTLSPTYISSTVTITEPPENTASPAPKSPHAIIFICLAVYFVIAK